MMDFESRTATLDDGRVKSCSLYSKPGNGCFGDRNLGRALDKGRIPMDTDTSSQSQSDEISEVDAATADYLRNAYAQLHGNRYRQMNRLLSSMEEQPAKEDCDIAVLAKNVANFGLKSTAKPIITFTPVHSAEERLPTLSPPASLPSSPATESRGSSGSSSPLLEVPTPDFHDMALEMMRPPLN